ncbi:RNA polymerase sigma factor [Flexithrix dorotheae]|uniref:RNA polymerase sigma factor n=1 Tax=Flexithrix dorotheae TaxID=70993 RepID=UPI00036A165D|nr:sigma-70 family RNA polymerase sigma factor [Flexithrix dorotheae]
MDDDYIKKVLGGDTTSFRYFITKYKHMAFTVAISIVKDEFIAEEIVQDAFVNVFRALKGFNNKSRFSTWFYKIVVNEAYRRLKKIKSSKIIYVENFSKEVPENGNKLVQENDEQIQRINFALKRLSANESLVLRLFYLQEESIKEVRAITGWSESKVKMTLSRARKSLHIQMTKLTKFSR